MILEKHSIIIVTRATSVFGLGVDIGRLRLRPLTLIIEDVIGCVNCEHINEMDLSRGIQSQDCAAARAIFENPGRVGELGKALVAEFFFSQTNFRFHGIAENRSLLEWFL